MNKLVLTAAIVLTFSTPAFAGVGHSGGHGSKVEIGQPGDANNVTQTIKVSMQETDDGMIFTPSSFEIGKGETVKFIITNIGELEHEFVMDTIAKNTEHKALMAKFDMEHDDPNSIRLDAGATGEIIWTFTSVGTFEFACLIPGHYESGMHGAISVKSSAQPLSTPKPLS